MKKRKVGRPTKYKPVYCAHLIRFFDIDRIIYRDITVTYKNGDTVDKSVAEASPTPYFVDWQRKIGISHETMITWTKKYSEFLAAYKEAKQLQEVFLQECALKGVHNSTFTIFTMKNVCGWRDEQHIKAEGLPEIRVFIQNIIKKAGIDETKGKTDTSYSEVKSRIS